MNFATARGWRYFASRLQNRLYGFFNTTFFCQALRLTPQAGDWASVVTVSRRYRYVRMILSGAIMAVCPLRNIFSEISAALQRNT